MNNEMAENAVTQRIYCIYSYAVTGDKIMYHISPYSLYIITSNVLARNQMYVSRGIVATLVMN